jgi:hypothetical protein
MDNTRLGQITALEMAVAWLFASAEPRGSFTAEEQVKLLRETMTPQIRKLLEAGKMRPAEQWDVTNGFTSTLEAIERYAKSFAQVVPKLDE